MLIKSVIASVTEKSYAEPRGSDAAILSKLGARPMQGNHAIASSLGMVRWSEDKKLLR